MSAIPKTRHSFGGCGCSYSKVHWKTIENLQFSHKFRKTLNDVIMAVFAVFKCGILTYSFFVEFACNLRTLIFNILLCIGLQTSILGSYLLSNMSRRKLRKNFKTKNRENIITKHLFLLILNR